MLEVKYIGVDEYDNSNAIFVSEMSRLNFEDTYFVLEDTEDTYSFVGFNSKFPKTWFK